MLPVLDLNLKVVNGRFEHGFFEKPCTSETVIPYTSAHSRKMKMSVLVEEGVRRLRNHSRELEWERSCCCSVGTTSLPISGIRFEEEKSFLLQRFAKDIGAFLEVL